MCNSDILILSASDIDTFLAGREMDLIQLVRAAYEAHEAGSSVSPQSVYLNFPDAPRNRIIAKPAYEGGGGIAGLKWVSSFPGNVDKGTERSSAVVMLNSSQTGRIIAIIEGSIINFKRTAASAALATQVLGSRSKEYSTGIIGCGSINFEVVNFLLAAFPQAREFMLYDLNRTRAESFARKCRDIHQDLIIGIAENIQDVLRHNLLISVATTAVEPHIDSLRVCLPGTLVLHISLRDIAVGGILTCENVVDDFEQICTAQTSIHLTERQVGHRDFISCSLGQILLGRRHPSENRKKPVVFSPFGLAVLDLAVAKFVYNMAVHDGRGRVINFFSP